jgi:polyisoprenoid-binding protein YceI
MRKVLKIGLPILLVLLAVAGVGFWYFVLRDTAPEQASIDNISSTTTAASGETTVAAPTSIEGTWTVQPGTDVFAGYRVQEEFGGDTIKKTAAGRSPAVAGAIVIAANQVTGGLFEVDMTKLVSDRDQRDSRLRTDGLETDTFPKANFNITAPVALGDVQPGVAMKLAVVGDLTLHGVTKPVTLQVEARWDGGSIAVSGSTPILMADFAIEPPNVGGFVSVDDNGVMEFQLRFVPAE